MSSDAYFENEVTRNPYHLKTWFQFIASKREASTVTRYAIYERALKKLPRSYKLWKAYLSEVSDRLKGKSISDKRFMGLKNIFERALVHMNKMPVIWYVLYILEYIYIYIYIYVYVCVIVIIIVSFMCLLT